MQYIIYNFGLDIVFQRSLYVGDYSDTLVNSAHDQLSVMLKYCRQLNLAQIDLLASIQSYVVMLHEE